MRILNSLLALALVVGLTAACSDDSGQTQLDSKVTGDVGNVEDGSPDGPPPDQNMKVDGGGGALLTTVVNKLTLPTDATEYAADIDGNGTKENQFGAINGTLIAVAKGTFDLQKDLNAQITDGVTILLFEVYAKSLTDDAAMKMQFHQGYDTDKDPKDNFTGNELFGLAPTSPSNAVMNGKIVSSRMTVGPGDLLIPIPMGASSLLVNVKKATVQADVNSTGMTKGQINGAVPWQDVDQKIIPALATMVDAYVNASPPPSNATFIKGLLDTDKNGTISADDIRKGILSLLLKADVDTDGDKKKDAMSVGMAFTAVTCKINKSPTTADAGTTTDTGTTSDAGTTADAGR